MKRKLTLTVDNKITQQAKRLARSRGQSLSALIQELLQQEADREFGKSGTPKFSTRWGGTMVLKTDPDERLAALSKKYGLEQDQ